MVSQLYYSNRIYTGTPCVVRMVRDLECNTPDKDEEYSFSKSSPIQSTNVPLLYLASLVSLASLVCIPNSDKGFKLLFSGNPFPGYQAQLVWVREEYGGHWYRWEPQNMEGWLCPALFKYFSEAPKIIYCKTEELSQH